MDDVPKFIHDPAAEQPVAAQERQMSGGDREHDDPPLSLWLSQDVQLVAGGTLTFPGASAVAQGELPAPWNPPVAHADRQVGGDKFTIRLRSTDS